MANETYATVSLSIIWGEIRQIRLFFKEDGVGVDITGADIVSEFRSPKGKSGALILRLSTTNGKIVIDDPTNGGFYLDIDGPDSFLFLKSKGSWDVWINRKAIIAGFWESEELTTDLTTP
jgi:hypothetical protein